MLLLVLLDNIRYKSLEAVPAHCPGLVVRVALEEMRAFLLKLNRHYYMSH